MPQKRGRKRQKPPDLERSEDLLHSLSKNPVQKKKHEEKAGERIAAEKKGARKLLTNC